MRDALPSLPLPPEQEAEVVDELAQLLEDTYADSGLEARRASDAEIAAWARAEVPWEELAATIRRQEQPVTSRLPAPRRTLRDRPRRRKEGLPMTSWIDDLRFAWRMLRKNPGFSFAAVLTLTVAIGLNTSVFSIVNAVFLRPLPVAEPEGLARVYSTIPKWNRVTRYLPVSYPDFEDLRHESRSFTELVGFATVFLALDTGDDAELVAAELATGNYFSDLGLQAAIGRTFTAAEDGKGSAASVAVLSHKTWQVRFGGDPAVLGRMVRLNSQSLTVIGVAPESFSGLAYPFVPEMWIPVGLAPTLNVLYAMNNFGDDPTIPLLDDRKHRWLSAIGRLAPGVTPAQAATELQTVGAGLAETYPSTNEDMSFRVLPANEVRIGPEADKGLKFVSALIMWFVGMVLLIAAANVANMLLARSAGRRKEIATRVALGASRGRLLRQLMLESLVLALLGGGAGLLLAIASNHALSRLEFFSLTLPGRYDLSLALDARVVTLTLLVATLTAVVFGLDPARVALRTDLTAALHRSSWGVGGASPQRVRNSMVIIQVALSVLLLVCGGLSMRSLWNANRVDPGFDPEGVVVATFMPDAQGYGKEQADELYRRMEDRLLGFSGIESVAFGMFPPLSFASNKVAVHPVSRGEPPKNLPFIDSTMITPGYFVTLRIPFLQGRDFTAHDDSSSSDVVIVSRAFAQRFWPGESALGQQLFIDDFRHPWTAEVVGVVADSKHRTLGESERPFLYRPYAQEPTFTWRTIFVRSDAPLAALAAIRQVTWELDEDLAISGLATLDETIGRQALWLARSGAKLFGLLGLIGLILAMIGIYAVTAYSVSQRKHEIGIRVAMGAELGQVIRLVLRRSVVLTICGVVLGVAFAFVVTWVLSAILYGISATDPVTFLVVPLVLACVAFTASWIPARRAASVDPLETLRCE